MAAGAFDLDFESSTPAGFFTGGNGYRVRVAPDVFKSGKQSLEMRQVAATPSQPSVSLAAAVAAWKDVVARLAAGRASYRAGGAADRDIDWIAQNARVVLQSLQMRSNDVTRDQSMADNVKWILDQSPGAKVVLWAHNGHVAPGSMAFRSMGSSLHKMFGDQMVVMGFAFNQGAFQAVEQGKALRNFTAAPAPAGSLDATLAATGLPLFAVDLRTAPKAGAVAEWLAEPHASRNIGAVYSDETAKNYLYPIKAAEWFDVLLFVETTTAARKNPGR